MTARRSGGWVGYAVDPLRLAHQVVAVALALPKLPDFCRHLAELELRVGQAELDIDDMDRDLARAEAVIREHHVNGPPTTAARRSR